VTPAGTISERPGLSVSTPERPLASASWYHKDASPQIRSAMMRSVSPLATV